VPEQTPTRRERGRRDLFRCGADRPANRHRQDTEPRKLGPRLPAGRRSTTFPTSRGQNGHRRRGGSSIPPAGTKTGRSRRRRFSNQFLVLRLTGRNPLLQAFGKHDGCRSPHTVPRPALSQVNFMPPRTRAPRNVNLVLGHDDTICTMSGDSGATLKQCPLSAGSSSVLILRQVICFSCPIH